MDTGRVGWTGERLADTFCTVDIAQDGRVPPRCYGRLCPFSGSDRRQPAARRIPCRRGHRSPGGTLWAMSFAPHHFVGQPEELRLVLGLADPLPLLAQFPGLRCRRAGDLAAVDAVLFRDGRAADAGLVVRTPSTRRSGSSRPACPRVAPSNGHAGVQEPRPPAPPERGPGCESGAQVAGPSLNGPAIAVCARGDRRTRAEGLLLRLFDHLTHEVSRRNEPAGAGQSLQETRAG